MSHADFRDTLQLLNTTLALVEQGQAVRPFTLQRRIRKLSLHLDLLRVRLQQPPTRQQRN